MKKVDFIKDRLTNLAVAIDPEISVLSPVFNSDGDDVVAVRVKYRNGYESVVNVECDSLAYIAIDVIKRIA